MDDGHNVPNHTYLWELTNVAPFGPFEKERKSSVFFAFMPSGLLPPKPFNRVSCRALQMVVLQIVIWEHSAFYRLTEDGWIVVMLGLRTMKQRNLNSFGLGVSSLVNDPTIQS